MIEGNDLEEFEFEPVGPRSYLGHGAHKNYSHTARTKETNIH